VRIFPNFTERASPNFSSSGPVFYEQASRLGHRKKRVFSMSETGGFIVKYGTRARIFSKFQGKSEPEFFQLGSRIFTHAEVIEKNRIYDEF
jgi:hypothetical protein